MNCTVHPESAATAYCRTCGKAMCDACKHTVQGVIYCEDCLATRVNQPAVAAVTYVPPPDAPSVGTATFLGFIPGVGAMYNSQFYKGLIHLAVFAGLIGLQTSDIPGGMHAMLGIAIGFWYIYMIVDANKTAKAKLYGLPLPDPFGFERMFSGNTGTSASNSANTAPPAGFVPVPPGQGGYVQQGYVPPPPDSNRNATPVGPIVLIGLGVLFLLHQFDLLRFTWLHRGWPLILIGLGIWLFIRRFGTGTTNPDQQ